MSGKQNRSKELTPPSAAFEYVSGTLRSEERRVFEAALEEDETLRAEVRFWEEQLIALSPQDQRKPSADTWDAISSQISDEAVTLGDNVNPSFSWAWFLPWATPSITALALMLVLFGYYPSVNKNTPNTDYVAVLTDQSGIAQLTTLATQKGKKMWVKWEIEALTPNTNGQLWAISKRDGEIRPIVVLGDTQIAAIELNETTWRLIADAEFLILTEEEPGGSAIDEPSDVLLAKGFCVRFSPAKKAG